MSSTTLPVCPKTGSTSPSLTVHLCLHTALLREIGNAPVLNTPTRHVDVHRLGDPTATGHPRHPLYLSANAALVLHAGRRP